MRAVLILLPVSVLAALLAFIVLGDPLATLTASAPPVEELSVEHVEIEPGAFRFSLRADGSIPVEVAQIQVDGAYRPFTIAPGGPIGRLASAAVTVPYPWVDGETHHIVFVTATGVTFEHTIDVAQVSPVLTAGSLIMLTLVGLLLGVAPVATGLLAYPALRSVGAGGIQFLLALTVGLLAFLLVDTLREGLEAGSETLGRLRGETLVWVTTGLTTLCLLAVGRRSGKPPEGLALATFVALGIGLHNLGEGLVVGAALATGAAALATFLVAGFVIHNVTEGIGIAAPLLRDRLSAARFVGLVLLAGLPAVFGVWAGAQTVSPVWVALCFGVGAGAILQVIVEVAGYSLRTNGRASLTQPPFAGGIVSGLVIMYLTALLI